MVSWNINHNLLPGGSVSLFDSKDLTDRIKEDMLKRRYTLTREDVTNPPDEDFPGEWIVTLTKPKEV